ncbi:MAG: hypothetical protein ABIR81_06500 [Ginsengibacter sp.]
MKIMMVCFVLVCFTTRSFGQSAPVENYKVNPYTIKMKHKRTAARLLLAGGITAIVIGGIISGENATYDYFQYPSLPTNINQRKTGDAVAYAGIGCGLVSIPFFISAHKNKVRAMSIVFTEERLTMPNSKTINSVVQPVFAIRLAL